MGKAFGKKKIEDQGEKQIGVNDYEDKLLHSKEREVFEDIYKRGLIKQKN